MVYFVRWVVVYSSKRNNFMERDIADFKIKYPVVQDNNYTIWNAYANHYWPAKYFIDKNGKIRSHHFGEGNYEESEKTIQELLAETGSSVTPDILNIPEETNYARTPETYLGYKRLVSLVSPEQVIPNQTKLYSLPRNLEKNSFAYQGGWMISDEYAQAGTNAGLDLSFEAKKVFLVMRSTNGVPHTVHVFLDGKEVTKENQGTDVQNQIVTVTEDRLYNLLELPTPGAHLLHLEFPDGNVEVYAFTFG